MGVASLILGMFLRKLKNRSGSNSAQIILKSSGKYNVVSTIGSAFTEQEIQKLWLLGKQELLRLTNQLKLFLSETDTVVDHIFDALEHTSVQTVGPLLAPSVPTSCTSASLRSINLCCFSSTGL